MKKVMMALTVIQFQKWAKKYHIFWDHDPISNIMNFRKYSQPKAKT